MQILVTGGTGFIGRQLALAALRAGHRVVAGGRNFEGAGALLAAGGRARIMDLRERAAVVDACAGMDAVIHAGALSAPWGRRADFFAANVDGTAAVVEGCRTHGVGRLIYVSSPSVIFSGRDQLNVTESAPYPRRFASSYSLTKKLGEDLVRASGLAYVIIRPKAVFGPGDRALLPRLLDAARAHRLPQIGGGSNLVDLTYIDNVVHALLLALETQTGLGKTFHITNDEHVPLWPVIRQVLQRAGLPARLRALPLSLVLAAAALMEARAALTGREPRLTRYSAAILARTQTYDIAAAKRELGYAPLVTVAEGIERTLTALCPA
jgi:2-alkyl-3-oxoalkanoate reductase